MDSILGLTTVILGLFPLSFYFSTRRSIHSEVRIITPLLILVFVSSAYELVVTYYFGVDVTYYFKIYSALEFLAVQYYFLRLLGRSYKPLTNGFGIAYFSAVGTLLLAGKFSKFLQGDSYVSAITSISVIVFTVCWFARIFEKLVVTSLLEYAHFYFVSALLLYFSGTMFLFLLGELIIQQDPGNFIAYWRLNIILNIVFYLLLIIGTWKARTK